MIGSKYPSDGQSNVATDLTRQSALTGDSMARVKAIC